MSEHENEATKDLATNSQLWRLNALGLVDLRDEPGEPLGRGPAKEVLSEAARRGLWVPTRGPRGPVRSG